MSSFAKLTPPADGKPVKVENGKMVIPDNPIIPFIRGDGMGPDIWKACELVFNAAVKKAYQGQKKIAWMRLYAGLDALQQYGQDQILPEDTLKAIRTYLIAIKGPLTTPVGEYPYVCMSCALEQGSPDAPRPLKCSQCGSEYITKKFRSMNVALRQMLDLYACVRPVKWIEGVPSPVKQPQKLDVVIFRENTEDVYAGIEFQKGEEDTAAVIDFISDKIGRKIRPDSGIGIKPVSVSGTKRLVRKAISFAVTQQRKSVTLVHKGNIMKYTEGAFRDWGYQLAREEFCEHIVTEQELWDEYNGNMPAGKILIKDRIADSIFQQVLLRPDEYDILACPNLNGDYLSDACAAQVGGLGMAPGSNIGDYIGLFEATHGTAPKYTGMDKVNPSSLLRSGILMFEYMQWHEAAALIESALTKTIKQKKVTYDLERQMEGATKVKTSEFARAIVANM